MARGVTVFDVKRGEELTVTERTGSADDTARRFDVELFLCAPNIAPTALGTEAHLAHHLGERRNRRRGFLSQENWFCQSQIYGRNGQIPSVSLAKLSDLELLLPLKVSKCLSDELRAV